MNKDEISRTLKRMDELIIENKFSAGQKSVCNMMIVARINDELFSYLMTLNPGQSAEYIVDNVKKNMGVSLLK